MTNYKKFISVMVLIAFLFYGSIPGFAESSGNNIKDQFKNAKAKYLDEHYDGAKEILIKALKDIHKNKTSNNEILWEIHLLLAITCEKKAEKIEKKADKKEEIKQAIKHFQEAGKQWRKFEKKGKKDKKPNVDSKIIQKEGKKLPGIKDINLKESKYIGTYFHKKKKFPWLLVV
jgi:hypothetical protein